MTRYARANGSKSCNARASADPTPWSEMVSPNKRAADSIEDDEVSTPKRDKKTPKKTPRVVKLEPGTPKTVLKSPVHLTSPLVPTTSAKKIKKTPLKLKAVETPKNSNTPQAGKLSQPSPVQTRSARKKKAEMNANIGTPNSKGITPTAAVKGTNLSTKTTPKSKTTTPKKGKKEAFQLKFDEMNSDDDSEDLDSDDNVCMGSVDSDDDLASDEEPLDAEQVERLKAELQSIINKPVSSKSILKTTKTPIKVVKTEVTETLSPAQKKQEVFSSFVNTEVTDKGITEKLAKTPKKKTKAQGKASPVLEKSPAEEANITEKTPVKGKAGAGPTQSPDEDVILSEMPTKEISDPVEAKEVSALINKTPAKKDVVTVKTPAKKGAVPIKTPAETDATLLKTPAKTNAAPVKTPAKTDAAPVKTPAKTDAAPVKTPAKTDAAPVKTPAKTDAAPVKTPAKTNAAPVKTPAKTDAAPVKTPAKTNAAPVKTPAKTDAAPVKTPAKTNAAPVKTPAKTDAAPVKTPAKTDAAPVKTPAKTDAAPLKTPAKTNAAPVKTDATPVKTDATPVKTDATPVKTDATPVKTDAETNAAPVKTPAKTDAAPVKTPAKIKEVKTEIEENETIAKQPSAGDSEIENAPQKLQASENAEEVSAKAAKVLAKKLKWAQKKAQKKALKAVDSKGVASDENRVGDTQLAKHETLKESNGGVKKSIVHDMVKHLNRKQIGQADRAKNKNNATTAEEERNVEVREKLRASGKTDEEIDRELPRIILSIQRRLRETRCLRCRKKGHMQRDCPVSKTRPASKCYKCGDMTHNVKDCSIKEDIFTYAECFICHQIGHLTRTCPSNTKGIYPQGGGCFKCGDNTHLSKFCPGAKRSKQDENETPEMVHKNIVVGLLDSKQSADADITDTVIEKKSVKASKQGNKKRVVQF